MIKTDKLTDKMRASFDPEALDFERETHIYFDDANSRDFKIDTGQKLVIESLMQNPDFKVDYLYTKDNKKDVIYLVGELPINFLRIKSKPTGKNKLSYILNH